MLRNSRSKGLLKSMHTNDTHLLYSYTFECAVRSQPNGVVDCIQLFENGLIPTLLTLSTGFSLTFDLYHSRMIRFVVTAFASYRRLKSGVETPR